METRRDALTGVWSIAGDLDISTGGELQAFLRECVAAAPDAVIDLSAVTSCDAAALQLFCAAQKTAECAGQPLTLTEMPTAVEESVTALGLSIPTSRS